MSKYQPLKELRDEREKNGTVLLAMPHFNGGHLLVLWRNDKPENLLREEYSVIGYVKLGEDCWEMLGVEGSFLDADFLEIQKYQKCEHLEECLEYINKRYNYNPE